MDLFQAADQAKLLRDAGMDRAAEAQNRAMPEWAELAYQAIVAIAMTQPQVHVDDVLRKFSVKPDRPNAWGHVWLRCIRERLIENSGVYAPCVSDAGKHLHRYPVYNSKIYRSA